MNPPCHKKRFLRKVDAQAALAICGATYSRDRKECRFYFCRECQAYHLTSQSTKPPSPKNRYPLSANESG
jgi:hypothetical protein